MIGARTSGLFFLPSDDLEPQKLEAAAVTSKKIRIRRRLSSFDFDGEKELMKAASFARKKKKRATVWAGTLADSAGPGRNSWPKKRGVGGTGDSILVGQSKQSTDITIKIDQLTILRDRDRDLRS